MSRAPRVTDTFRWRLAIGAALIAGGYAAWLIIPIVVASELNPNVKTPLTVFLGATPLLTKLIAIALLGRPTINFLKRHFKLFRRDSGGAHWPDVRVGSMLSIKAMRVAANGDSVC